MAAMLSREPPFRTGAVFVLGASEGAVLMATDTVDHDESVDKFWLRFHCTRPIFRMAGQDGPISVDSLNADGLRSPDNGKAPWRPRRAHVRSSPGDLEETVKESHVAAPATHRQVGRTATRRSGGQAMTWVRFD